MLPLTEQRHVSSEQIDRSTETASRVVRTDQQMHRENGVMCCQNTSTDSQNSVMCGQNTSTDSQNCVMCCENTSTDRQNGLTEQRHVLLPHFCRFL